MYSTCKNLTLLHIHTIIRQVHMSQIPIITGLSHLQPKLPIPLKPKHIEAPIKELKSLIVLKGISHSNSTLSLDLIPANSQNLHMIVGIYEIS